MIVLLKAGDDCKKRTVSDSLMKKRADDENLIKSR